MQQVRRVGAGSAGSGISHFRGRSTGCGWLRALAAGLLATGIGMAGAARGALTHWKDPRPAAVADHKTLLEAGSFTYNTDDKWQSGAAPLNASNEIVSIEERTSIDTTTTIDGTVTVGEFYARSANVVIYVRKGAGGGKLVFDNGANPANFYLHSAITRFTALRCGFDVDLELKSDLNVFTGTARQSDAAVGVLGGTISGPGKLTLNLANNDGSNVRLFKFGVNGTNTYSGGTLVRHVLNTAYGAGHGVQALVQLAVKSAGAFGTGDVTLDATGCTASNYGGLGTGRGLWVRLDAPDVFARLSTLYVVTASRLALDLNGTTQAVTRLVVDGAPVTDGLYTGGAFGWLFGKGLLTVGASVPPAVLTVVPGSGALPAGDTVTVTAEAGGDAGAVTARAIANGPNGAWTVTGLALHDTVPAGTNRVAFATLGGLDNLLNGAPVEGVLALTLDGKILHGATVNGLAAPQTLTYALQGSVTGRTAPGDTPQTASVPAGGDLGGLSTTDAPGAGTLAAFDTTVTFAAGTNRGPARTVSVTYPGAQAGAADVGSDVVSVAGVDGETFVLQLNYDPASLPGGEGDARLVWRQNGVWVDAVWGNAGTNAPQFMGAAAWAGETTPGRHGVDTANDRVWAVLNHAGVMAAAQPTAWPIAPVMTYPTAADIGTDSALLGATLAVDGGAAVTHYGTVWGASPAPTEHPQAEAGAWQGVFTQTQTGLPVAAHLYARGWASNAVGTAYSPDIEFYTEPWQASNVVFSAVTSSAMVVSWTPGNGEGRLVVLRAGGPVSVAPADGLAYAASPLFGAGAYLGDGNVVVHAGAGDTVAVTGLSRATTYGVAVYEYAGAGALVNYRQAAPALGTATTAAFARSYEYDGTTAGNASVAANWDDPLNYTADNGFPDGAGDALLSTAAAASYYQLNGNRTLGAFRKTYTSARNIAIVPGSVPNAKLTWQTLPGGGNAQFYVRGAAGLWGADLRCLSLVDMVLATNLVWDGSTQRGVDLSETLGTGNGHIRGDISGPGRLILKWNCARSDLYLGVPMHLELWGGAGPNTHGGGTEFRKNDLGTRAGFRLNKEHATGAGHTLVGQDAEIYVAAVAAAGGAIHDATSVYLETDGTARGRIELEDGVAEKVQDLYLYDIGRGAWARQERGTYGSTASRAAHMDDRWFGGTGVLDVLVGAPRGTLLIVR